MSHGCDSQDTSLFLKARRAYQPRYPRALAELAHLVVEPQGYCEPNASKDERQHIQQLFPATYHQPILRLLTRGDRDNHQIRPLHVGVVLSGGPAPGGHNVICGILEGLQRLDQDTTLTGFIGGPSGILKNEAVTITTDMVHEYRNTGGFDMLGSGRTKLETTEDFERCVQTLKQRGINALVVIGGDDSNTNAAMLAEFVGAQESGITIIGVPKTIDGDLKNQYVETSFGFDTAVRVYAEMISNIARDALSGRKYYHFIRLMGRAASHITMEAALQTHPNVTLISEEVAAHGRSLDDIVESIVDVIVARAAGGKNYGIVLVPEGVIEFLPDFKALITELNDSLAKHKDHFDTLNGFTEKSEYLSHKLSRDSSYTFSSLPIDIQRQLVMDRDPHGNVIVSRIETESLLIELIEMRLKELKTEGRYQGAFGFQRHFLGYEGRCAAPSNFDADYAYSLGLTAVALANAGANGYMAVVRNLALHRDRWESMGVPLTAMMTLEMRHGALKPVIKKALVDLNSRSFQRLAETRRRWAEEDCYRFAGSIQYFGPEQLVDQVPSCLALDLGLNVE